MIESLVADKDQPALKVFFFGGEDGVAEQAARKLNDAHAGLICTGSYSPGFGSIESMSTETIINTINQADADFLIVSLGAKKGHKWIQHNRHKLNAPVISHLGAVVNFVAGTVKRSPTVLQRLGLEWLWRIYQEPALYKRYAKDAAVLAKLIVKHYYPALKHSRRYPQPATPGSFTVTNDGPHINYCLTGQVCEPFMTDFLASLKQWEISRETVLHFDMSQTTFIDSQIAGVMLRLKGICDQQSASFKITQISSETRKMLRYFMVNI